MKGLVRKRMVIAILGVAIGSPGILMARSRRMLPPRSDLEASWWQSRSMAMMSVFINDQRSRDRFLLNFATR